MTTGWSVVQYDQSKELTDRPCDSFTTVNGSIDVDNSDRLQVIRQGRGDETKS